MCQAFSLSALYLLRHLILAKTLRSQCSPCFTHEETVLLSTWVSVTVASTRQQDPGPILITIVKRERDKMNNWPEIPTSLCRLFSGWYWSFLPVFSWSPCIDFLKWSCQNHTPLNLEEKYFTESVYLEPFLGD